MILIDHDGSFYKIWKAFHVLCCLSSSFMYGYLSCFRNVSPEFYTLDIMFESIFLISMIIEFITGNQPLHLGHSGTMYSSQSDVRQNMCLCGGGRAYRMQM